MHAALDLLITTNAVTSACKTFLQKSKRTAECYDNIIYGEISSFTLWNMNGNNASVVSNAVPTKISENVAYGIQACSNVPLNMEAVVNPCVKSVDFTLTGPYLTYTRIHNSTSTKLIFDTAAHKSTFGGRYLTPGSYTLRATPDSFVYREKRLNFRVNSL
jgi:hypothetical protein